MAVASGLIVVDIGNTRVKSGEVDSLGLLGQTWAFPVDKTKLWSELWLRWHSSGCQPHAIAISSVNPQVALELESFLGQLDPERTIRPLWYRSAADVPIPHQIVHAETAGADRALAVAAAMDMLPEGRPGLVVSCGTAITVERITVDRIWEGGVIAVGLGLAARALRQNTAQLPAIEPRLQPPAWGNSTRPSMEAGIYWGVVGAVREILRKQQDDLLRQPSIIWTGGDAHTIAGEVEGSEARIVPQLVLQGLIRLSRQGNGGSDR